MPCAAPAHSMHGFLIGTCWQRPWNTGAAWTQIGKITTFSERMGKRFVPGSAVWLPPELPLNAPPQLVEYEVKAEAIQTTASVDTILATETRHIIVGDNLPPTVEIISGPLSPSTIFKQAVFEAATSDPDGSATPESCSFFARQPVC